jgi:hypothetical protein
MKSSLYLISLIYPLLVGFAPMSALAMTFEKQERCLAALNPNCQTMVIAEGPITASTPLEFKEWSKDLPKGTWIALTSPGGSVVGGMKLGMAIREGGFNTTIANTEISPTNCLSACAYAFVGGLTRYIPPNGRYGLHQYHSIDKEIKADEAQKLNAVMAQYLDSMGIDRRLLDYAQLTAPNKIMILSQAQAKQLRVDNLGQSPFSRWRLEATEGGQLITLNTAIIQNRLPMTMGFTKIQNKIIGVIYYKNNDDLAFATKTPHNLIINQHVFTLQPLGIWQEKKGGHQVNFEIPHAAVEALVKIPEEGFFQTSAEFFQAPMGFKNPIEAKFGVGGLKNAIGILNKTGAN